MNTSVSGADMCVDEHVSSYDRMEEWLDGGIFVPVNANRETMIEGFVFRWFSIITVIHV